MVLQLSARFVYLCLEFQNSTLPWSFSYSSNSPMPFWGVTGKTELFNPFFTGYTGSLCERPVCATNPCRYGGTCLGSNTGPGFLCLCPVGRGGALCQGKLYFVFYLTSNYCAKGVLVWSNIGIIALCWNLLTTGWAKLPWIPFRPNPLII